jgi:hypothetical protein
MRLEQIMCYQTGWSDRNMVRKDWPASHTSMWHQQTSLLDGPPNLVHTALLTKFIRVQGRFLSCSVLFLFFDFMLLVFFVLYIVSSFCSPSLYCFFISALPFFLPYLISFLGRSHLFIYSFPSLIPIPLFLRFSLYFPSHIYILLIFYHPCFL